MQRNFMQYVIIQVADFNMDSRGRLVWADIWGVLSSHFAAIGSHDNVQVSMLLSQIRVEVGVYICKHIFRHIVLCVWLMSPVNFMRMGSAEQSLGCYRQP